jgi:hypothetical protein
MRVVGRNAYGKRDYFQNRTIEIIALSLLSESDLYGYQLVQTISERSDGVITIQIGSLYPVEAALGKILSVPTDPQKGEPPDEWHTKVASSKSKYVTIPRTTTLYCDKTETFLKP